MTNPSLTRARRIAGAVLVATTLGLSASTVVPAMPAAASAPAASNVVGLRKGARGDAVKALQEALVRVGVGVKYGVDGYFGSATQASVKAFQRIKSLSVTGVVDATTASTLGLPAAPRSATATPATDLLGRGSVGPLVAQVQQALINFGFPIASGADGVFGASTERALKAFQKANGLGVSGRTFPSTMRALGVVAVAAAAAPAVAPAATAGSTSTELLGRGSTGPVVLQVQQALTRLGFPVAADGVFGATTEQALRRFQRANGLGVSGRTYPSTMRHLGVVAVAAAPAAAPAAPAATGATAGGFAAYDERGARVVALQQALINAGIPLRGGADGAFGSATAGAVMAFQRAKGLTASGKVDEATAAALGLAAMAAPAAAAAPAVQLEAKPVQGPCYYGDSWNASRGTSRVHLGVDILAAEGNALYAAITGKISQIYTDQPGSLSGNGLKIARPDGTYVFYGHLSALAPGMAVGVPVSAGQVIGYVGHTGNAAGPHLHLEVHPLGGAAVNPYPIVKAIGAC